MCYYVELLEAAVMFGQLRGVAKAGCCSRWGTSARSFEPLQHSSFLPPFTFWSITFCSITFCSITFCSITPATFVRRPDCNWFQKITAALEALKSYPASLHHERVLRMRLRQVHNTYGSTTQTISLPLPGLSQAISKCFRYLCEIPFLSSTRKRVNHSL